MSYDFHITRREYWSDENGPRISLGEWQDYVSSDSDVSSDGDDQQYVLTVGDERCVLSWERIGELRTPNPSPAAISKLVTIADALDARLLGDDDEIYGMDSSDPSIPFLR